MLLSTAAEPSRDAADIVVWRVPLDHAARAAASTRVLSTEELAQAAAMRHDTDRVAWMAMRTAVRHILGFALRQSPEALTFVLGAYGKPALQMPEPWKAQHDSHTTVRSLPAFNTSRSRGLGVLAIVTGSPMEIGVDVEWTGRPVCVETVADQFLSSCERRALWCESTESRTHAFFRCWTRKEAYAKALGRGLHLPFDEFSVPVNASPDEFSVSCEAYGAPTPRQWLRDLSLGEAYQGAIACGAAGCSIRYADWSWSDG